MEDLEKYMKEALREAEIAGEEDEVPIGAVIVHKGRIIGKGRNMTERLHDATAHAEMIAITAATEAVGGKYLNDCTLYVTVEPCPMCAGALAWSQIGKVVYGAADPKRGFSQFTPSLMHPKTEIISGVLSEECGLLVKDFFKKKTQLVMEWLEGLGLFGLFIGTFLAATIFPFSSDALYLAILAATADPSGCLIVGTLGNWLGSVFTYWIGWIGRWEWIEKWFKVKPETLEKQKSKIDRWGIWLALTCWVPIIGDVIAIALGFYKTRPLATILLMFVGKFGRFLVWNWVYGLF